MHEHGGLISGDIHFENLLRVFLWTFGAFLVIHFGLEFLHFDEWISRYLNGILLLAVLLVGF